MTRAEIGMPLCLPAGRLFRAAARKTFVDLPAILCPF